MYLLGGDTPGGSRVAGAADRRLSRGGPNVILIANDPGRSRWSRKHQRNLTAVQWRVEALVGALRDGGIDDPAAMIEIVPGTFWGTDTELEALGRFLEGRPDIRSVALVTSRYHVRRMLRRARAHIPAARIAGVVPARRTWRDHAPWTVAWELLKLARDTAGLTNAPLLCRSWWMGAD